MESQPKSDVTEQPAQQIEHAWAVEQSKPGKTAWGVEHELAEDNGQRVGEAEVDHRGVNSGEENTVRAD